MMQRLHHQSCERKHRLLNMLTTGIVAAILLGGRPSAAQFTTGSLGGTVTDPTGAAVADAKVMVRNTETALTRTVQSASDGGFLFSSLPVGVYNLTVEKAGFSTYVQEGVVLHI